MKVTEHLALAKNPLISVEIIPPKRGHSLQKLHEAIASIKPYNPPFIDVTSHSAEVIWEEMRDGTFKKRVKRKSPGTFGLCAAIKYKFEIDPVPHILCSGFTREETEDALIELNYLGIENVLAIRGDGKIKKNDRPDRSTNEYAVDLVAQLMRLNQGIYQDELIDAAHTDFCVGVSYYPEKHFEAPNLKFDMEILLQKQNAGASYGVSQMFFENSSYHSYVAESRKMGVNIPLIPGLKILTTKSQLTVIPSIFHVDLPEELTERMLKADTKEKQVEVGVDWAVKQTLELLESGVPCVHFYIMQNTQPFVTLMEKLKKKI
ncbi:MAG: methylenetetrahydrofolate reductase [Bacteroidetes bacterium]|nr:methylenetetrahydrofolate reductase [Bacteroidota bacterium]